MKKIIPTRNLWLLILSGVVIFVLGFIMAGSTLEAQSPPTPSGPVYYFAYPAYGLQGHTAVALGRHDYIGRPKICRIMGTDYQLGYDSYYVIYPKKGVSDQMAVGWSNNIFVPGTRLGNIVYVASCEAIITDPFSYLGGEYALYAVQIYQ